ncbi:MAG: hypothetical protein AAFR93_08820 [Pseudomonadota bacterium]
MSEIILNSPHGTARFEPTCGRLSFLRLAPRAEGLLHTAPWVFEDRTLDLPLVEQGLAGDFFCAPFGASSHAPLHGWTANSAWRVRPSTGALTARLKRQVQGARITKTLAFASAPALIQTHIIEDGSGPLPVAHHPMVRAAGRTWLSFSPKAYAATLPDPLELGRNWLAPGQKAPLDGLLDRNGAPAALDAYPDVPKVEEFVVLVEADPEGLGWTAVLREGRDDMILVLKNTANLPATMLWISNGGRDAPPWDGRHVGVLGIEDGHPPLAHGDLMPPGRAALSLGGQLTTHHALLHLPRPKGWTHVNDITLADDTLRVEGPLGASPLSLPLSAAALGL